MIAPPSVAVLWVKIESRITKPALKADSASAPPSPWVTEFPVIFTS